MVKPPFEHFQFSQKLPIFGRFEKKSCQKLLEPNTYSVCNPNTSWYMVFDPIFYENAPIVVKNSDFYYF